MTGKTFIDKPQASWGKDRPQVGSGSPTASFGSKNRAVFTVNIIRAGGPELLYGVFLEKIRFLSNSSVANAQWTLPGRSGSHLGQAYLLSWSCAPEKRRRDLRRPPGRNRGHSDGATRQAPGSQPPAHPQLHLGFPHRFPFSPLAVTQRWKADSALALFTGCVAIARCE